MSRSHEQELPVARFKGLKIKPEEETVTDKLKRLSSRRQNTSSNRRASDRQRHYSAPDLSFGRNMDLSLLQTANSNLPETRSKVLEKFSNETLVRPVGKQHIEHKLFYKQR